ncbi:MFS transporter [Ottowia thiooxydans]|uniref:MFS family arabinose efflux permease n=1 Tax=Ottowia thiooxydans TaxID=219182 RepID=A0ABV2QDT9_9BURK
MQKRPTTVLLGLSQTLAWASSYYLPAILADAVGKDLGISRGTVFGAFSVALLVSAAIGPLAGKLIDRWGGRPVLMSSNLVFAIALAALSQAQHPLQVFAAWALMGVAMGGGLYEAAFATAVHLHGQGARRTITGITLFAGFASTIGWPLTAWLNSSFGWRDACLVWASLHLVIALPLNAMLPATVRKPKDAEDVASRPEQPSVLAADQWRSAAVLMAFVFAVAWFTSTAMAAHLPHLLRDAGATAAAAVGIAAVVGPAQVAGRLIEFSFLRRTHPLLSSRLAMLAHPLGALCIGVFGSSAALAFAVLHGLGNGILTIAIGTLPLIFFGSKGYGQRQGLLMVPARIVQAGAPFIFGVAVERLGTGSLWISAGLGLAASIALTRMAVKMRR